MRPSKIDYFMTIAQVVSTRGTCIRRQVGCVLIDFHDHIMSTGYNGVPKGMPHCIDEPCSGADCESGQGLELCEAIHAEQNALLQCKDTNFIKACYTTVFPCMHCIKLLMNTSCNEIFYMNTYTNMEKSAKRWLQSNDYRKMTIVPLKYIIKEIE
jgi:dCMP deaminase